MEEKGEKLMTNVSDQGIEFVINDVPATTQDQTQTPEQKKLD
jgi:hypothetical protein